MKTITLPFVKFLDYFFESDDFKSTDDISFAAYLASLDPEEQSIHIEMPGKDNNFTIPRVYRIAFWKTEKLLYDRKKAASEKYRYKSCRTSELSASLARRVKAITGLDDPVISKIVIELIRTRNNFISLNVYGVDISELIELDKQE